MDDVVSTKVQAEPSNGSNYPPLDVGPIVPTLTEIPYKILERQDWIRSITAIAFVGIFALTVLFSFLVIFLGSSWASTKDLLQLLLPAESALLGSALGFYFGAKTAGTGSS